MDKIRKAYHYIEPNLLLIGWLGVCLFPVLFFMGTFSSFNGYSSPIFTIVCTSLFVLMLLSDRFPKSIHKHYPLLFYIIIGISFPLCFYYMLVMNLWSELWGMIFIICVLIHVILIQYIALIVLHLVLAISIAYFLVFWQLGYIPYIIVYWPYVILFFVSYVISYVLYSRSQISTESKVSIAKSFGAGIAHEMRNPMSALKISMDILRSTLVKNNEVIDKKTLTKKELDQINSIINFSDEIIRSATETIDILLTSIDQNRISKSSFKHYCANDVVLDSINSFPYRSERDKNSINFNVYDKFDYYGSDVLLKYTIYNLLKNAFYYNHSDDFIIDIQLKTVGPWNVIKFRDNGVGIEADLLGEIFQDFSSFGKQGGFGLGLSFCAKVMEAFDGKITCESRVNQWTEFTLYFPPDDSPGVNGASSSGLPRAKILYIGDKDRVSDAVSSWSFRQGFDFTRMHLHRACTLTKLEYDLVMVDIENAMLQLTDWRNFESLILLTGIKACYLHNEYASTIHQIDSSAYMEKIAFQDWDEVGEERVEKLLFDSQTLLQHQDEAYQPHYQGMKLLLVDDNYSILTLTSMLLEKEGYHVTPCQESSQVISLLENQHFDAAIFDIEMPMLNGIELTQQIRRSPGKMKEMIIIGYTGDNTSVTIQAMFDAGITDYLVKPASRDQLVTMLDHCLRVADATISDE